MRVQNKRLYAFLACIFDENGILRNLDRTRTRTRTRTKRGLEKNPDSTLGLTFEKSRTCFHKTRTRLIKKPNSKLDSLKTWF